MVLYHFRSVSLKSILQFASAFLWILLSLGTYLFCLIKYIEINNLNLNLKYLVSDMHNYTM